MHAYPRDLALLVQQRWTDGPGEEREGSEAVAESELPDLSALERLLSTCYQASLLHEEGRPVTFRIALAEPESFRPSAVHPRAFTASS